MSTGKFTASTKLGAKKGAKPRTPTSIENEVAQAFIALETPETKDLKFLSAKEVDVGHGKHAVIIVVPYVQRKAFRSQSV